MVALSCNSTKTSVFRVYTTLTSFMFSSIYLPNCIATASVTSFSFVFLPWQPGSFPPCPASITTVLKEKVGLNFGEKELTKKQGIMNVSK